ncbi:hypothetical protein [Aeromicrobium sp. 9AM]|uniref:hypothetical protein n=1 Tax=Aeromicrobium sp. 9AM TaxID=2653126 RepID=UPI0012F46DEB|nr:hypothetical protein [Aeromicrobium sp. 9AM]VXB82122.1 conserved hypothetical protein [Aeromicrobium sp. 9AM]
MTAPVYATLADYRNWLDDQTVDVSDALFARASEVIDEVLIGAVYAIDDNTQLPTLTAQIEAIRDATCAQVQWGLANGDTTGTGTATEWDSVAIGSVKLSGKKTLASSPMTTRSGASVAPDAVRVLRIAGLLPATVLTYG